MSGLERFRGHFYNWYDTRDLRPLDPQYVSSVDSGNLAGHLIALANACREWTASPPDAARRLAGIEDALDLARGGARPARRPPDADGDLAASSMTRSTRWSPPRGRRRSPAMTSPNGSCDSPARPRPWSTSPARWPANAATRPARICCSGRRPVGRSIDCAPRRSLTRRGCSRLAAGAPRRARRRRASMALAMEFGFLLDPERKLLSIGYRVRRRHARPELLRPARLRGAARELRRHRQGRRSGAPLVPARPRRDAGRARRGADLLVGIDVRVPDAVARDARAGRQPARADEPAHRAPADRVRRRARRAVGHLGVRLQRARPRAHLSVFELRRARPRPEARPRREPS